jgi:hypothetical protein
MARVIAMNGAMTGLDFACCSESTKKAVDARRASTVV